MATVRFATATSGVLRSSFGRFTAEVPCMTKLGVAARLADQESNESTGGTSSASPTNGGLLECFAIRMYLIIKPPLNAPVIR